MQFNRISNWKTVSAAALALLALAALLISASALPVAAQTSGDQGGSTSVPSISVSGFGQASGAPDVAYITLGVDVSNSDVGEVVSQANDETNAVIAAITDTGIAPEDIQTVNFNVWPEDRSDPNTGAPTGERVYHVSNQVSVTVRDISKIGTVIDAGLSAGADSVYGLNFGIAEQTDLEQVARLQAVENARDRASKLAEAMGVTLGDPIIISETFGSGASPVAFDAARGLGGGGGAPPINPGQLNVAVTINVTFAISQ